MTAMKIISSFILTVGTLIGSSALAGHDDCVLGINIKGQQTQHKVFGSYDCYLCEDRRNKCIAKCMMHIETHGREPLAQYTCSLRDTLFEYPRKKFEDQAKVAADERAGASNRNTRAWQLQFVKFYLKFDGVSTVNAQLISLTTQDLCFGFLAKGPTLYHLVDSNSAIGLNANQYSYLTCEAVHLMAKRNQTTYTSVFNFQ